MTFVDAQEIQVHPTFYTKHDPDRGVLHINWFDGNDFQSLQLESGSEITHPDLPIAISSPTPLSPDNFVLSDHDLTPTIINEVEFPEQGISAKVANPYNLSDPTNLHVNETIYHTTVGQLNAKGVKVVYMSTHPTHALLVPQDNTQFTPEQLKQLPSIFQPTNNLQTA